MNQDGDKSLLQLFLNGKISRRDFINKAAALGISASAVSSLIHMAHAQQPISIRWWDILLPLQELHEEIWADYMAENPDVRIEYTLQNDPGMGQALQLAYRSGQAPDVHTLSGLGVPPLALVQEGWFVPLEPHITRDTPGLQDVLFEGITVFDGRVYSFPIFSTRWHTTSAWFNRELVEQAGFDPDTGPVTWDEFRQASRAITEQGGGRVFGTVMFLQFTSRIGVQLTELAQVAGAPGPIDWRTGEYAYNSDPFVEALEFLYSLQEDGSLHPASSSLDARQARARWAAGEAGFIFDGPWNAGVLLSNYPEVLDTLGVGPIPRPDANTPAHTYAGVPGGLFWVSSQSEHPEIAADLLRRFTSREYYARLAERMDQPPLDLSAVEDADVHPAYRQALRNFQNTVRLAPDPVVRNPNVAQVYAEMRDISPNLGEIVQGVFSGAVRDIRATLTELNDRFTAERARALEIVQARGVEVSLNDWIFPNWVPGEDYTPERYEEL